MEQEKRGNLKQKYNWKTSIKEVRIDGLANIFLTNILCFKIIWTILFFGTSIVCFYLINDIIKYFLKNPKTSTTRRFSELKPHFPTVSLCNMNPLNTDYYLQLLKQANVTEYHKNHYYNLLDLEYYFLKTTGSLLSFEQKRKLIDIEGLVISCTFQNKPCNSSNFRYRFFSDWLACYQFNSGFDTYGNPVEVQHAQMGGKYNELTMELYLGIPNEFTQVISRRGMRIIITNQSEDTFKNSPSPIVLTPGIGLNINVVRNVYSQFNQWPYSYSDCTVREDGTLIKPLDDMEYFNKVIESNFTYTQDSCLLYCCQVYSVKHCSCYNYWVNFKVKGAGYCLSPDEQVCADHFYYSVFNVGNFIVDHCMDKCPLECNKHRYDNYVSLFPYPDKLYFESKLKKNPMLLRKYANQTDFKDRLASNVAKFSLIHDSLSYFEVTEGPEITWQILLGKIGGHLHLFKGMSVISFVELLEVAFFIAMHTAWYRHISSSTYRF